ncbi:MAG: hypothetical protein MI922_13640, partial [Bacteroidales bacterium]|nr:hypothetical protein [Bacteroidales bacterium]
ILMFFSLIVTTQFDKISDAWKFVLACSAGIGLVLILRWFWWRINAWSEISAMLAPYSIFPVLKFGFGWDVIQSDFEKSLIVIVIWSTVVWIIVTLLTPPTNKEKLKSFYTKVHPGGKGWMPISKELPDVVGDKGYQYLFINWILGCILVIFTLFGFGKLIFHEIGIGVTYLVIASISGAGIFLNLSKTGWNKFK